MGWLDGGAQRAGTRAAEHVLRQALYGRPYELGTVWLGTMGLRSMGLGSMGLGTMGLGSGWVGICGVGLYAGVAPPPHAHPAGETVSPHPLRRRSRDSHISPQLSSQTGQVARRRETGRAAVRVDTPAARAPAPEAAVRWAEIATKIAAEAAAEASS